MEAMAAAVGVDRASGLRLPGAARATSADLRLLTASGYPTCGTVEFVPSEAHIKASRVYTDDDALMAAAVGVGGEAVVEGGRRREVCVWGTNALDGQRRIWIEQVHARSTMYRPA